MKPLILLAMVLVGATLMRGGDATLFQNWAREMARNQILHILRHHPDLISEVIQHQRLQQQLQQQQQMGLNPNSLSGNQINNQLRPNQFQPQQQQQQGFNGNSVMGTSQINPLNQQLLENQLQDEQQQQQQQEQQLVQQQQRLAYNELVRRTQNGYPKQGIIV